MRVPVHTLSEGLAGSPHRRQLLLAFFVVVVCQIIQLLNVCVLAFFLASLPFVPKFCVSVYWTSVKLLHETVRIQTKKTNLSALKTNPSTLQLAPGLIKKILSPTKLSLLLLAAGCAILFVLRLISTAYLFPQFEQFGKDTQAWALCSLQVPFCDSLSGDFEGQDDQEILAGSAVSEIIANCKIWVDLAGEGKGCGERPQSKPSHPIMIMSSFADGLLPLLVSIAFTLRAASEALKKVTNKKVHVNQPSTGHLGYHPLSSANRQSSATAHREPTTAQVVKVTASKQKAES